VRQSLSPLTRDIGEIIGSKGPDLQRLAEQKRAAYLLTDTDSMLFVASEKGGLVPCPGGQHKTADGTPAIKAITWKQVEEICTQLNRLNPYDRKVIADTLKVEDCNRDRKGIVMESITLVGRDDECNRHFRLPVR
jgi:hypothetical protein